MNRLFLLPIIVLCLFSIVLRADLIPEAQTSEATLEADYKTKVDPFFAGGKTGTFEGWNSASLFYRTFEVEKEKGAVVYVTGWTETSEKYAELIFSLNKSGYSVYAMDNRGMGLSSRLSSNPKMVHVESYDEYVADLKKFVNTVVKKKSHKKTFMLTHSMGGLIGAIYATMYPMDFDAFVFSSPLFQVHTGNIPEGVAYRLAKTAIFWGNAKGYILTHSDSTPAESSNFKEQTSTHSENRWGKKVALWYKVPQSFMSGSSNRWLQRTIESTWWLKDSGAEKISAPVMIFKASEDTRVWNPGVDAVCEKIRNCESHLIKGGYHELFLEGDSIRGPILNKLLSFFERN